MNRVPSVPLRTLGRKSFATTMYYQMCRLIYGRNHRNCAHIEGKDRGREILCKLFIYISPLYMDFRNGISPYGRHIPLEYERLDECRKH